ncbi:NAD(P)-dependent oxidoreductase [Amycolatopsis nivea]|uniref:NAD(P)-dependent oxidoreductase n=1 Tax=Amycolatopsis nivea TaxID=1644109 RepID=UPI00106FC64C|nr:NAD(P)-binding domain-containing protein [Amycolatopsis nivea]
MDEQAEFDVALLGCGNMGAALGRAVLAGGRSLTAWNRSAEKAQSLERFGARTASSAREAVGSARTTLACLSTYEVLENVLEDADLPAGHTLINVTTGAPGDANRMSRWADKQEVHYLDGAVLAFPEQIGGPECQLLVAGPLEVWESHRELVRSLGGASRHVSNDAHGANVLDIAGVGAFYGTSILAFIEAARFVTASGVAVSEMVQLARQLEEVLHAAQDQFAEALETGDFSTDQATIDVYHAGVGPFRDAISERLESAPMFEAATGLLKRGVEAGFGAQSLYALFNLYRTR